MLTAKPRGTADIIPGQVEKWQALEQVIAAICQKYRYQEIRTPIFEHTELFVRGVGEDTDIVAKEMYTFQDRGQRSITLRPEGTASVVRAFLENKLHTGALPVKLYYIGPMFRYDRPQAGRMRQFHQFGVEAFGSHHPALDAEVMALAMDFFRRLELTDLELHVNSVGCPQCRPVLRQKLQDFFQPWQDELCVHCRSRYTTNPLRILDCKTKRCVEISQSAPTVQDGLCQDCQSHFQQVLLYMEKLNVPFVVNTKLVRGLDYYTHTAFEVMARGIGAQSSICGGGRYNGLVQACGGPDVPGVGFALGLERILLAMENQNKTIDTEENTQVFVVAADAHSVPMACTLLAQIRAAGIAADMDYQSRSLKAQMKLVGRQNIPWALIIGESERQRQVVNLRDMQAGQQTELSIADLIIYLKQQIGL